LRFKEPLGLCFEGLGDVLWLPWAWEFIVIAASGVEQCVGGPLSRSL